MPTRALFMPREDPLGALADHVGKSVGRGNYVIVVDVAGEAQALRERLAARGVDAARFIVLQGPVKAAGAANAASDLEGPAVLLDVMRTTRGLIAQQGRRSHVIVHNVDALAQRHSTATLQETARYVELTRRFEGIPVDYVVKDEAGLGPGLQDFLSHLVDDEIDLDGRPPASA